MAGCRLCHGVGKGGGCKSAACLFVPTRGNRLFGEPRSNGKGYHDGQDHCLHFNPSPPQPFPTRVAVTSTWWRGGDGGQRASCQACQENVPQKHMAKCSSVVATQRYSSDRSLPFVCTSHSLPAPPSTHTLHTNPQTSMRTISSIGAGALGLLLVLGVSQVAAFRPVAVPRAAAARTGGKIPTASSCAALSQAPSLPCRPLYSTVA